MEGGVETKPSRRRASLPVVGRAILEFRVLGELEVRRADRLVALPQSKKTRALLAYLVLTDREHRRERLCDLLWDVADDRRGALRWSLSKLRAICDDDDARRINADRDRVSFVALGARVDALELRRTFASKPMEGIPTDVLETWAIAFRGELLEGLDLADFDEYQAWCVAEREQARSLRTAILRELTRRLSDDASRAVVHARAWVAVDPLDDRARVALVRLLGVLGRRDEARQHHEAGRRLEKELGRAPNPELSAAWREVEERTSSRSTPSQDAARAAAQAPPRDTTTSRPPAPSPSVSGAQPPSPSTPQTASVSLVGRTHEMATLSSLAERVCRDRRLGVIVLSGEPGVGKTRLLEEWARRVREARGAAIRGVAFEAESGNPYGPWLDALADARGVPAMPADGGSGIARELLDGELPSRERLFARVSMALAEIASHTKILAIVLDDVQWLDEGSAELLHWVARTNRDRPIAVALATRQGEIADNAALVRVLRGLRREGVVDELSIGSLRPEETAALVEPLGGDVDAARIHARSGGNPLFALELARAGAGPRSSSTSGELPPSLGGLVRDRIAQLPEAAAEVVRWAAILGSSFRQEQIDGLVSLDTDAVVTALELLERRFMLVRDGASYAFGHDVVRQVVYADLSEPRRRLMHRRVAQMLARAAGNIGDIGAAGDIVADVARHAALAHDAALAAEACLAAARRSLRVFANADAFALARRGTRHAERLEEPERTKRLLELAEVTFDARRPEDVDAESKRIEALAERAVDLGCREHARLGFYLVSFLRWERGGWSDAKRHMLQAELVSRGASEVERVRGMAEAARCLVLLERDLGHAQALALEAAARGRQVGVEPPATFDALGMLQLHQGYIAEARAELERARGLARSHRDHHDEFQALEHIVMLEIERGDCAAALARAEELAALGERFREGSEAPFARALVALARVALGADAAQSELDREIDALTIADAKHRLAYVLTRAALLDLDRLAEDSDADRARRRAERALSIAKLLERTTELALAHLALIRWARHAKVGEVEASHRSALRCLDSRLIAAPVRTMIQAALDATAPDERGAE